ncbi:2-C-methyl-D-erythritol 4-phosphate cytidylyltransferase [Nocardia terpenica]|uniref:2-C-methyl-D-erythritol 4-phosphate cytidylyltransferase n=1 Tax=Nocardia terpenica TaxID=455432 RepID=UPI001894B5EC|nr:2-C-methyl-D-erythritol 4-phosphate cytidylyltransferase [Nocardia terpenica]MBF6062417.1 2-C-methyl-D-erythritol 4-phosphate cytidylyltransferase [Nocardia terpenica]MBF6104505.1 2-C-methyl-D-erythritol 4-phosphate cytidylyltransferase [Nocardia terpenica]MBF6109640.1 2-C-methyl-D-erythritol 4-phosphate cytidylyltransferase [Nocardia terpenica]MBF6119945.1 2-C-methyl-D-erythritol 4-phosphate cytidylyltransferase [Nocardia terpenica]MBF6152356.1 2-C-methyl-D-erythritol 4-phosphate cytidylyl
MGSPRHIVALVPAAGQGVRLGEQLPKAFVPVGGTPMLTLAVDGLIASGVVDHIVIMAPDALIDAAVAMLPAGPVPVSVVAGGVERTDSVRAGLAAAPLATHVLVHDAARALTPPSLIARVVAELIAGHPAVVPGLPVTDTVKAVDADSVVTGTPDRAGLRAIQTPQGFDARLLRDAYAQNLPATDDAGLVEMLGAPVRVIPGDPLAFKITTQLDLRLARTLLADNPTRAVVRP